ncbi:hypothetical protein SteCoe_27514 [Stentor coeruleus]|uniref:Uncharacterized protein n=1 Tax=Stentor coeruleus TaxID=5963 RepID=A0A1R2BAG1_9CILI|nr:hypothetical protein SteCoe_27514 [Stentor coeruleus]
MLYLGMLYSGILYTDMLYSGILYTDMLYSGILYTVSILYTGDIIYTGILYIGINNVVTIYNYSSKMIEFDENIFEQNYNNWISRYPECQN